MGSGAGQRDDNQMGLTAAVWGEKKWELLGRRDLERFAGGLDQHRERSIAHHQIQELSRFTSGAIHLQDASASQNL